MHAKAPLTWGFLYVHGVWSDGEKVTNPHLAYNALFAGGYVSPSRSDAEVVSHLVGCFL